MKSNEHTAEIDIPVGRLRLVTKDMTENADLPGSPEEVEVMIERLRRDAVKGEIGLTQQDLIQDHRSGQGGTIPAPMTIQGYCHWTVQCMTKIKHRLSILR